MCPTQSAILSAKVGKPQSWMFLVSSSSIVRATFVPTLSGAFEGFAATTCFQNGLCAGKVLAHREHRFVYSLNISLPQQTQFGMAGPPHPALLRFRMRWKYMPG